MVTLYDILYSNKCHKVLVIISDFYCIYCGGGGGTSPLRACMPPHPDLAKPVEAVMSFVTTDRSEERERRSALAR